jgi:hypothetical protein
VLASMDSSALDSLPLRKTAEASSFPCWRIGVTGHARLEVLNETTQQFVRSGKTMPYTRQS